MSCGTRTRVRASRPIRTYMRLMVAYDSGWVLTALVGLLMAWRDASAGGEVWIGYQTAAPLVFAALLLVSTPVPPASDIRAEDSEHWHRTSAADSAIPLGDPAVAPHLLRTIVSITPALSCTKWSPLASRHTVTPKEPLLCGVQDTAAGAVRGLSGVRTPA